MRTAGLLESDSSVSPPEVFRIPFFCLTLCLPSVSPTHLPSPLTPKTPTGWSNTFQKSGMGMLGLGVGGAGKYVPPSRKVGFAGRGEAGPEGSSPAPMGEDHTKIRVTNISEDTTEGDLRDLFNAFGRINR